MSENYEITYVNSTSSSSSGGDGQSGVFVHNGGPLYIGIQGVWGGAGVAIQVSYDKGATWGILNDFAGNGIAVAAGAGVDNSAYHSKIETTPCYIKAVGDTLGVTTNLVVTFSNVP